MQSVTMPAGKFYVGDLCYVMNNEWEQVHALMYPNGNAKNGKFALADGREFVNFTTKYGDGNYTTSEGEQIGVDSGTIGCIAVKDLTSEFSDEVLKNFGTVVEFNHEFECTSAASGEMSFGHIDVDTGSDDDDDGDDWEDEEEDDYTELE